MMMASDFLQMLTKIKNRKLTLLQAIMCKLYITAHAINNLIQKVDFGFLKKFMISESNLSNQEKEN
jgi:hypothetical protein